MDLVVWIDGCNQVLGFQLSYDKPHAEKAVTWHRDGDRLSHSAIDDGEHRAGKPKSSPMLVADGRLDPWNLCGKFVRLNRGLPSEINTLVCQRLLAGQGNHSE